MFSKNIDELKDYTKQMLTTETGQSNKNAPKGSNTFVTQMATDEQDNFGNPIQMKKLTQNVNRY